MTALVPLEQIPQLIERERAQLAHITRPRDAANAERRAAAMAELTKRAGLAVPIQNEATFLRAEALQLLANLVDEGQAAGEINANHRPEKLSESRTLPVPRQRVAEGRALARTDAISKARDEAAKYPDKPVSMDSLLKQAKRSEREGRLREATRAREAEAQRQIAQSKTKPYKLTHASITDWRPTGVASIITDPPYVGDSIPLYQALREFALDVLPAGGPLVVMTWQAILPQVIAALDDPGLAYRWCICWRYANTENTADQKRRVFDCWKPILVYHRGAMPADAPMIRDEIANTAGDKDHHAWGQSVQGFERLVASFSQPGELVCDPFLGGGTTAVAALSQSRRFAGCDTDKDAIATTRKRLQA